MGIVDGNFLAGIQAFDIDGPVIGLAAKLLFQLFFQLCHLRDRCSVIKNDFLLQILIQRLVSLLQDLISGRLRDRFSRTQHVIFTGFYDSCGGESINRFVRVVTDHLAVRPGYSLTVGLELQAGTVQRPVQDHNKIFLADRVIGGECRICPGIDQVQAAAPVDIGSQILIRADIRPLGGCRSHVGIRMEQLTDRGDGLRTCYRRFHAFRNDRDVGRLQKYCVVCTEYGSGAIRRHGNDFL